MDSGSRLLSNIRCVVSWIGLVPGLKTIDKNEEFKRRVLTRGLDLNMRMVLSFSSHFIFRFLAASPLPHTHHTLLKDPIALALILRDSAHTRVAAATGHTSAHRGRDGRAGNGCGLALASHMSLAPYRLLIGFFLAFTVKLRFSPRGLIFQKFFRHSSKCGENV